MKNLKPETLLLAAADAADIASLRCYMEPSEKRVWISKTQCGTRYTLIGVPAKQLDIILVEKPDDKYLAPVWELCKKTGRYEGVRTRLTLRYMTISQVRDLPVGKLVVEAEDPIDGIQNYGFINLKLSTPDDFRKFRFHQWRTAIAFNSDADIEKIIGWHYSRYYRFLPESVMSPCKSEFVTEIKNDFSGTLAEANRIASRILYRAARELGWRKLTKKEQDRLGLEGQWQSEDRYAVAQEQRHCGKFSATGCGEHTLCSARPRAERS